jgi:molybdopterin/thiamine biosynthesis adenylyltransferase
VIVVLLMAAAIWGIGAAMGAPRQARLLMLGLLLTAVLMVQVVLPDGHPLREATGGEPGLWLLLLGMVAAVWAYRQAFRRVKARADAIQAPPPARPGALGGDEIGRYARHIALREIGGAGQRRLREAGVLVVGAGGLGAPALLYLAAAGVGRLGVIDPDEVEPSNLQRQVIHRTEDVGRPKVQAAADAVAALNPHVRVLTYRRTLEPAIAAALFADYDLILDGTDGWAAHALCNEAAVEARRPLIQGALSQWEGQVALWHPEGGGPCRACVFPEAPAPGLAPSCAEAGVAGPLPGVVGAIMALEAVKLLTGAGEPLRGRLLLYDGLDAEARTLAVEARPGCPVCGGRGA